MKPLNVSDAVQDFYSKIGRLPKKQNKNKIKQDSEPDLPEHYGPEQQRLIYWATRSYVCSFVCNAHSFACYALLAALACSAALTHSLARSLRSLPRSRESE